MYGSIKTKNAGKGRRQEGRLPGIPIQLPNQESQPPNFRAGDAQKKLIHQDLVQIIHNLVSDPLNQAYPNQYIHLIK
jgi:hypothetical protein